MDDPIFVAEWETEDTVMIVAVGHSFEQCRQAMKEAVKGRHSHESRWAKPTICIKEWSPGKPARVGNWENLPYKIVARYDHTGNREKLINGG